MTHAHARRCAPLCELLSSPRLFMLVKEHVLVSAYGPGKWGSSSCLGGERGKINAIGQQSREAAALRPVSQELGLS